jgi:hypothetical protein
MNIVLPFILTFALVLQSAPAVKMSFAPESDKFVEATKEYQALWANEGAKMISALEEVSGLRFPPDDVKVVVFEGASNSGYGDKPMKLRASYPADVKKATLIHELGHRLNWRIRNRPDDVDEHRILFLYLYDVWSKLYGKEFADRMVEVEKKRKGIYDYETAWNWALSMTAQERAARLRKIIAATT